MTDERGAPRQPSEPATPALALAIAGALFVALIVCGFGVASLLTDTDVIPTPGLGPWPGVLGVATTTALFLAVLWRGYLRLFAPSYMGAFWAMFGAWVTYVLATALVAALSAQSIATGAALAATLAWGWQGVVVAVGAFVSSWTAIALRRTRAHAPRWPWETS